jgi:hypothetical protein
MCLTFVMYRSTSGRCSWLSTDPSQASVLHGHRHILTCPRTCSYQRPSSYTIPDMHDELHVEAADPKQGN